MPRSQNATAGRAKAPTKPKTARGEATKKAILTAAERVIGAQGYNEASIGDITREAGVGQGTFYIYFKSKEEVFHELVIEMGRLVRRELSSVARDATDRLAAEKAGLKAFLEFVRAHPDLYRVVQEAMFVAPDAYKAYYDTFADGYREGLVAAAEAGQVSPGDAHTRAWALMGMARALGERAVIWGDETPVDDIVETTHDLIVNGLRPS
ncbi:MULTISPECIES: TetR/AcrR family transcriptional regulator [Pseudovibrio]|uniref:TetR/AcrR family transcriptional regulator n=1 Tax=Stappiaceae TaxID=2821832 RepID=UPI002366DC88|nr:MULTISPECIES: TetR/AcrR family transcriptional regulator [Pseudovibrio]MDD7909645.1 TetR/AcrR family transcriptional regulator [Pseudovibrio exalbescens]MDX5591971.1 TetR/AcrR family transcriptional regulator [Pseudovibrio sp. SPO723]